MQMLEWMISSNINSKTFKDSNSTLANIYSSQNDLKKPGNKKVKANKQPLYENVVLSAHLKNKQQDILSSKNFNLGVLRSSTPFSKSRKIDAEKEQNNREVQLNKELKPLDHQQTYQIEQDKLQQQQHQSIQQFKQESENLNSEKKSKSRFSGFHFRRSPFRRSSALITSSQFSSNTIKNKQNPIKNKKSLLLKKRIYLPGRTMSQAPWENSVFRCNPLHEDNAFLMLENVENANSLVNKQAMISSFQKDFHNQSKQIEFVKKNFNYEISAKVNDLKSKSSTSLTQKNQEKTASFFVNNYEINPYLPAKNTQFINKNQKDAFEPIYSQVKIKKPNACVKNTNKMYKLHQTLRQKLQGTQQVKQSGAYFNKSLSKPSKLISNRKMQRKSDKYDIGKEKNHKNRDEAGYFGTKKNVNRKLGPNYAKEKNKKYVLPAYSKTKRSYQLRRMYDTLKIYLDKSHRRKRIANKRRRLLKPSRAKIVYVLKKRHRPRRRLVYLKHRRSISSSLTYMSSFNDGSSYEQSYSSESSYQSVYVLHRPSRPLKVRTRKAKKTSKNMKLFKYLIRGCSFKQNNTDDYYDEADIKYIRKKKRKIKRKKSRREAILNDSTIYVSSASSVESLSNISEHYEENKQRIMRRTHIESNSDSKLLRKTTANQFIYDSNKKREEKEMLETNSVKSFKTAMHPHEMSRKNAQFTLKFNDFTNVTSIGARKSPLLTSTRVENRTLRTANGRVVSRSEDIHLKKPIGNRKDEFKSANNDFSELTLTENLYNNNNLNNLDTRFYIQSSRQAQRNDLSYLTSKHNGSVSTDLNRMDMNATSLDLMNMKRKLNKESRTLETKGFKTGKASALSRRTVQNERCNNEENNDCDASVDTRSKKSHTYYYKNKAYHKSKTLLPTHNAQRNPANSQTLKTNINSMQQLYINWCLDPGYKRALENWEVKCGLHDWAIWRTKINENLILTSMFNTPLILNKNNKNFVTNGGKNEPDLTQKHHSSHNNLAIGSNAPDDYSNKMLNKFQIEPRIARFIYYLGFMREKPSIDPESFMFYGLPRVHLGKPSSINAHQQNTNNQVVDAHQADLVNEYDYNDEHYLIDEIYDEQPTSNHEQHQAVFKENGKSNEKHDETLKVTEHQINKIKGSPTTHRGDEAAMPHKTEENKSNNLRSVFCQKASEEIVKELNGKEIETNKLKAQDDMFQLKSSIKKERNNSEPRIITGINVKEKVKAFEHAAENNFAQLNLVRSPSNNKLKEHHNKQASNGSNLKADDEQQADHTLNGKGNDISNNTIESTEKTKRNEQQTIAKRKEKENDEELRTFYKNHQSRTAAAMLSSSSSSCQFVSPPLPGHFTVDDKRDLADLKRDINVNSLILNTSICSAMGMNDSTTLMIASGDNVHKQDADQSIMLMTQNPAFISSHVMNNDDSSCIKQTRAKHDVLKAVEGDIIFGHKKDGSVVESRSKSSHFASFADSLASAFHTTKKMSASADSIHRNKLKTKAKQHSNKADAAMPTRAKTATDEAHNSCESLLNKSNKNLVKNERYNYLAPLKNMLKSKHRSRSTVPPDNEQVRAAAVAVVEATMAAISPPIAKEIEKKRVEKTGTNPTKKKEYVKNSRTHRNEDKCKYTKRNKTKKSGESSKSDKVIKKEFHDENYEENDDNNDDERRVNERNRSKASSKNHHRKHKEAVATTPLSPCQTSPCKKKTTKKLNLPNMAPESIQLKVSKYLNEADDMKILTTSLHHIENACSLDQDLIDLSSSSFKNSPSESSFKTKTKQKNNKFNINKKEKKKSTKQLNRSEEPASSSKANTIKFDALTKKKMLSSALEKAKTLKPPSKPAPKFFEDEEKSPQVPPTPPPPPPPPAPPLSLLAEPLTLRNDMQKEKSKVKQKRTKSASSSTNHNNPETVGENSLDQLNESIFKLVPPNQPPPPPPMTYMAHHSTSSLGTHLSNDKMRKKTYSSSGHQEMNNLEKSLTTISQYSNTNNNNFTQKSSSRAADVSLKKLNESQNTRHSNTSLSPIPSAAKMTLGKTLNKKLQYASDEKAQKQAAKKNMSNSSNFEFQPQHQAPKIEKNGLNKQHASEDEEDEILLNEIEYKNRMIAAKTSRADQNFKLKNKSQSNEHKSNASMEILNDETVYIESTTSKNRRRTKMLNSASTMKSHNLIQSRIEYEYDEDDEYLVEASANNNNNNHTPTQSQNLESNMKNSLCTSQFTNKTLNSKCSKLPPSGQHHMSSSSYSRTINESITMSSATTFSNRTRPKTSKEILQEIARLTNGTTPSIYRTSGANSVVTTNGHGMSDLDSSFSSNSKFASHAKRFNVIHTNVK